MVHALVVAAFSVLAAVQAQHSPQVPSTDRPSGALFATAVPRQGPVVVFPQTTGLPIQGRIIERGVLTLHRGPCGMPIIVSDPKVDPKMVVAIPEREKAAAKIRAIEPPQCFGR